MTNWRALYGDPEIPRRTSVIACKYLLEEELRKKNGDSFAKYLTDKTAEYAVTVYCKQLIMLMHHTHQKGQLTRMTAVNEALREITGTEDKKDPSYLLFSTMNTIYNKPNYETYMDKGPYPLIVDLFYATAHERDIEGSYEKVGKQNDDFEIFPE